MTAQLAPLAVAVPLLGGALTAVLGPRVPRTLLSIGSIGAMAFVTAACAALARDAAAYGTQIHWFGGWTPHNGVALGIAFAVDPVSGSLAAFAALLTAVSLVFSWTYYEQEDGSFTSLMLVFGGALVGFFLTGDLFNAFVFFELMSVSAYALTGFRSEDPSAVQGAFAFAVVNSTGAILLLAGIAMVYARTGALYMAQIAHALGGRSDALIVVAFALIVVGFLVKAAIVPFHFWLGDAHAVAPTPLCALFSGIMVQAGLYAVARCYWSVFAGALEPHAGALRGVLLTIGLATAVTGAVMCYAQRHLKRLLAFSTVAHSGLMLCGIAFLSPAGLAGFFVYVLGHGLLKGALFLGSGIVLNRYQSLDVEVLRRRLAELPWLAALFALGALGIAGMPPFGTYVGKALIDSAAERDGGAWIATVLTLTAALTGGSILNAAGRMTFGWGPPPDPCALTPGSEQRETKPATGRALAVMAIPAIVLLALAFTIGCISVAAPLSVAASERFAHGAGMVTAFDLTPGVEAGLAAAACAVLVALAGLWGHRARRIWPHVARAYERVMCLPHAWHSGIVTDYLTWLVAGTTALTAAVLFAVR